MEVVIKSLYLDIPLVAGKDDGVVVIRRQCESNEDMFSYKVGDIVQTHLFPKPLQIEQIEYKFVEGIVRFLTFPISCGNNEEREKLITSLNKDGRLVFINRPRRTPPTIN